MKEGKTEGKKESGGRRGWRSCWRKTSEQRLMSRTKKVTLQRSGRQKDKTKESKWLTRPEGKNQTDKR